jgi:retinol dehydrogenase-12
VILTGDIYIRSSECTSDFTYEGRSGGGMAYCRSKLGNLWFVAELTRRHPQLQVIAAHPGVVASNLGGQAKGFEAFIKNVMMLDVPAGAQTPLYCATQPNLERGGYYHNTMGLVRLPEGDPAADPQKAAALWARLEALGAEFLT